MVQPITNKTPSVDVAEAIVRVGKLARELQEISGSSFPSATDIALKATEIREYAGVIRSWAHLTNAGICSDVAISN